MLRRLIAKLSAVFAERFDRSPIADVDRLTRFLRTRSAYVAQTSLYGYLKTRMGMSFERYFQDESYAASIREAAVRLFASCLADLTVFTVATAASERRLSGAEAAALAIHCYREALAEGIGASESEGASAAATDRFAARVAKTSWTDAARGEAAFAGSAGDLIRFAPVVDEFKALDREIVTNSIRFRWRDIREQCRRRLDAAAVADGWRRHQVE